MKHLKLEGKGELKEGLGMRRVGRSGKGTIEGKGEGNEKGKKIRDIEGGVSKEGEMRSTFDIICSMEFSQVMLFLTIIFIIIIIVIIIVNITTIIIVYCHHVFCRIIMVIIFIANIIIMISEINTILSLSSHHHSHYQQSYHHFHYHPHRHLYHCYLLLPMLLLTPTTTNDINTDINKHRP